MSVNVRASGVTSAPFIVVGAPGDALAAGGAEGWGNGVEGSVTLAACGRNLDGNLGRSVRGARRPVAMWTGPYRRSTAFSPARESCSLSRRPR